MFRNRRCYYIESLLWGYAANTLNATERAEAEAHLANCDGCRQALQTYRQIAPAVAEARETAPPRSQANWEELRQRIEATNSAPNANARRPRAGRFALLGATLAGACAILLAMRPHNAPEVAPINLQMAALPASASANVSVTAGVVKKPAPSSGKTVKPAPGEAEGYRVYPAFEKQEIKRSSHKKSAPMVANYAPAGRVVARNQPDKEHTLKFALDAEVPLERDSSAYVMGSVPSSGYSVVPASYQDKELRAW